jgi:hypothetical protein
MVLLPRGVAVDMATHPQKVRALAVAIANAERVLGLPSGQGAPLTWRVERIIQATQSGGLDRRTYRAVWLVRSRLVALCEPQPK